MGKMKTQTNQTVFAALKLIEQLYTDGSIPECVFQNILLSYANELSAEDLNRFADINKGGSENCID